jgi:hypothetical protein
MQVSKEAVTAINELVAVRADFYKKIEQVENALGLPTCGLEIMACESVIDWDFADRTDGLNDAEIAHFIDELVES